MKTRFRFYHFAKFHKNPLIDLLYNERFRRIIAMTNFIAKKNSSMHTVLDLGCGSGHFSSVLSLRFTTIGLDVSKGFEVEGRTKTLNFIIADISSLPFRSNCADIVVCASVLEHMRELNGIAKEVKSVLKKDGFFIAGYPVETKLFKFIWKLVSPWSFRFIDQSQTYWINPNTGEPECYWESPHTHKQDYKTIRRALSTHFQVIQKVKLPSNTLPDFAAYYECIKCKI